MRAPRRGGRRPPANVRRAPAPGAIANSVGDRRRTGRSIALRGDSARHGHDTVPVVADTRAEDPYHPMRREHVDLAKRDVDGQRKAHADHRIWVETTSVPSRTVTTARWVAAAPLPRAQPVAVVREGLDDDESHGVPKSHTPGCLATSGPGGAESARAPFPPAGDAWAGDESSAPRSKLRASSKMNMDPRPSRADRDQEAVSGLMLPSV